MILHVQPCSVAAAAFTEFCLLLSVVKRHSRSHRWLGLFQGFVKQMLDVADNLERAASAVPGAALENGEAVDTAELQKQLRTLLEGVQMTQQVLNQVGLVR